MKDDTTREILQSFFEVMPSVRCKLVNVEDFLGDIKLKPSNFKVMMILSQHSGMSLSEICRLVNICRPNCSKNIDEIIKLNFAKRENDPNDRRIYRISLTDEGRSFLENKMLLMSQEMIKKLSILSESEMQELRDGFKKVANIMAKL